MHKLAIQAPPKLLVEKYLIEIAKNYNIEYEADPTVMLDDQKSTLDSILIDLGNDSNNLDGAGGGGGMAPQPGFIGYPQMPTLPQMPQLPANTPFQYPRQGPSGGGGGAASYTPPTAPFNYNIPPNPSNSLPTDEKKDLNINQNFLREERSNEQPPPPSYDSLSPDDNMQVSS